MQFDFTDHGRRPAASHIIARWKAAGRPNCFSVVYGETFAEFALGGGRWHDSGNGCRGVKRDAVVKLLTAAGTVPTPGSPQW